jgi:hypothetical protein
VSTAPTSVNWWLAVRWSAQSRVYDKELPVPARRDWAAATLQLTQCLERFTGYSHWDAIIDEVNLRCYAINDLGELPGDPACDVQGLLRAVTGAVTVAPDRALALASHWRDLPREQILLLRQHKRMFGPLAVLADRLPDGPETDQIRVWFAVRPHLP